MKRISSALLFLALLLLLAACNSPEEPEQAPAPQDASDEEVAAAEPDYCDLPGGTRVTWFDLSTFIFIPENSFQMGFDEPDGEFDYEPAHPVSLGAFWMHEAEVTNRQYANCVTAGQCPAPENYPDLPYWFEEVERLDDPVVGVTWEQADAYCQWIGTRLPTEAEWELAARGVDSHPYPWGADEPNCEQANFMGCLEPEEPQPIPAGLLDEGISSFEILDMAGNVNEWVSDWYGQDYYQESPASDPPGPAEGEMRVWRGGGYQSPGEEMLSYLRGSLEPDQAQPDLGFRCAWSCGEDVPPQLCQLPPAVEVSQPPIGKPEPSGPPKVTGEGYCEWRGGSQSAGVVLSGPEGADLSQYEFSSPNGDVTCTPVAGDLIVCHGPGVQPDSNVTFTICPECPSGQAFDQESGQCKHLIAFFPGLQELDFSAPEGVDSRLVEAGLTESVCDPGYYYIKECGCIPENTLCAVVEEPETVEAEVATPVELVVVTATPVELVVVTATPEGYTGGDPPPPDDGTWFIDSFFDVWTNLSPEPGQVGLAPGLEALPMFPQFPVPEEDDCNQGPLMRCPPNHFVMTDANGCQVCWPLRTMPDCPEGYFFDTEANCCIPEVPNPVCPWWTYYDPVANLCIPIVFERPSCFDVTVYVPPCGPRPTPDNSGGCSNPTQYSNQTSCENAGCVWVPPVTGGPGGSCTMP